MEQLFRIFVTKLKGLSPTHKRYLYAQIDWSDRLIGIKGGKGTGKTTLLLQHIQAHFKPGPEVPTANHNFDNIIRKSGFHHP
jgi:Cdc6-like AAA superfamily ATPase